MNDGTKPANDVQSVDTLTGLSTSQEVSASSAECAEREAEQLQASSNGRGAGERTKLQSGRQDPLHGQTLEMIVKHLVNTFGFEELGKRVPIRCFTHDPSVSSSLKFLRRTPWARKQVEALFLSLKG
jgi:hypothetical protein